MALLKKDHRIFVAGHHGLVGSAIVRELRRKNYTHVITANRSELNLLHQENVSAFFKAQSIDCVVMAAAKVGGIVANNTLRYDFILQNLQLQNSIIQAAHDHNVGRLIFLGSSCIYPRDASQPMKETSLLSGPLEITNRPYALAKIAGLEMVDSLRRQHNRDYFSAMPTNLYGPNDNFHPEHSHVLPALIRKFHEAKINLLPAVEVWGSGKPFREFMHSDDCARAIIHLAEQLSFEQLQESEIGRAGWSHINIGSQQELSIGDLAQLISNLIGYQGKIEFNTSRPDGTPRKLMDSSFLYSTGFKLSHSFESGLRNAIDWYNLSLKTVIQ